jgi:hypothetical protein
MNRRSTDLDPRPHAADLGRLIILCAVLWLLVVL